MLLATDLTEGRQRGMNRALRVARNYVICGEDQGRRFINSRVLECLPFRRLLT